MRIAINGIGVAGPALAYWLRQYGHEPVLYEIADELRGGGYVIDFWGTGYEIAEKMGILGKLKERAYFVDTLKVVNDRGDVRVAMKIGGLRSLLNGRFFTIARSDISAVLFEACRGVEAHFGTSVLSYSEDAGGVDAVLSNGSRERFDLLIGADGLHSHIRELMFDATRSVEHGLGAYVMAFTVPDYPHREENVYVSHLRPLRQMARFSLRDNQTLFLLTIHSSLVKNEPGSREEIKALAEEVYRGGGWESSAMLDFFDSAGNMYFDRVSQIKLDNWTKGRAALIGDAAACISLLGGEGTGLAIIEAYVLARELDRLSGDYGGAFRAYHRRLGRFLLKKQKMALQSLPFFAPRNKFDVFLSKAFFTVSGLPVIGRLAVRSMLKGEIPLEEL